MTMTSFVYVSRAVAFAAGCISLYIAFFFTKNDDGKVQNRLVELWVRIELLSERTDRRVIAFFNETASFTNRLIDRLFGPHLFSIRFIVASSVFSMVSLYILTALRFGAASRFVVLFICFAVVVVAKPRAVVIAGVGALSAFLLYWANRGDASSSRNAFVGVSLGLFLDFTFVAISRKILREITVERQLKKISFAMVINFVLGVLLLAPSLFFVSNRLLCWLLYGSQIAQNRVLSKIVWWIIVASATNLFAGLCAFAVFMVAGIALLHQLCWPLGSKMIYVSYERKLVENRKFFFIVGSGLLAYTFHGFSWLSKIPF
jgi:hypothetical protein